MYKILFMAFAVVALTSVACKQKNQVKVGEASAYVCPMHPAEVSVTPGVCAVCKMALIPMENAAAAYSCPMDCEKGKTYGKPGTCPECKMDLEPAKKSE